jgi:hypothetical protein
MSDIVIPRAQHEALMLALRAAVMLDKAEDFHNCAVMNAKGRKSRKPVRFASRCSMRRA